MRGEGLSDLVRPVPASLAALLAICLPALVLASELTLDVVPAKAVFGITEPVVVRVTVTNESESTSAILIPRMLPEGSGPYPTLSFVVRDERGTTLSALPNHSSKVPVPALCDFRWLTPGTFFGSRFALTGPGYGFIFQGRGIYRVKAVLTTNAREWLEKRQGTDGFPKEGVQLMMPAVFSERLESRDVPFEVR